MDRNVMVCLLLGTLVILWRVNDSAQSPRLMGENFERITNGMTQDEVEQLFGRPPGDYGR